MAKYDPIITQLQDERDRLDKAIAVLNSLTGKTTQAARSSRNRHISPAGLARIRAAAKKRRAKVRAQKKK